MKQLHLVLELRLFNALTKSYKNLEKNTDLFQILSKWEYFLSIWASYSPISTKNLGGFHDLCQCGAHLSTRPGPDRPRPRSFHNSLDIILPFSRFSSSVWQGLCYKGTFNTSPQGVRRIGFLDRETLMPQKAVFCIAPDRNCDPLQILQHP